MKPVKVFIVDDHEVVRRGIAAVLNHEPDLQLCGEADTVAGARAGIAQSSPDIALVDISMENDSGLDLIHSLAAAPLRLPVLVISMHDELVYIQHAMRAGARGYFHKHDAVRNVPVAIRKIQKGQSYFSDEISDKIAGLLASGIPVEDPLRDLSAREQEIFNLLGRGIRRRQIAEQLSISAKTVSAHLENIKTKLRLSAVDELLQYAVRYQNSRPA